MSARWRRSSSRSATPRSASGGPTRRLLVFADVARVPRRRSRRGGGRQGATRRGSTAPRFDRTPRSWRRVPRCWPMLLCRLARGRHRRLPAPARSSAGRPRCHRRRWPGLQARGAFRDRSRPRYAADRLGLDRPANRYATERGHMTDPRIPLSVLDLAPITSGGTAAEALANSVDLARHVEAAGYRRTGWRAPFHPWCAPVWSRRPLVDSRRRSCDHPFIGDLGGADGPSHRPCRSWSSSASSTGSSRAGSTSGWAGRGSAASRASGSPRVGRDGPADGPAPETRHQSSGPSTWWTGSSSRSRSTTPSCSETFVSAGCSVGSNSRVRSRPTTASRWWRSSASSTAPWSRPKATRSLRFPGKARTSRCGSSGQRRAECPGRG